MWITRALSWAEAAEPDYHRLVMFFYVQQIYPTRGPLPDLQRPPNEVEGIDNIRRGLENAPPDQTTPDPSKSLGTMVKDTVMEALWDVDNQYAIGPTDPLIFTGVKGQLYGDIRM